MTPHDIIKAETVLQNNKTAAFLTSGCSMYPLLRTHKDIVVITKAEKPLKINDVALYKKSGFEKLVLHRIIGILPNGVYVIRGDNTYCKEYIPQEDIIGVMTAFYRNGKHTDCKTSKTYKIYVKAVKLFYPIRFIWKTKIRVFLSKIKQKLKAILGDKNA